jgi:hypothetical protein
MKTKYRNRKQPTKKKARKNKTLKHKKSRKTRRLKRRSSKRRGGVRPSTTKALMAGLNQLDGVASLHHLFINTAYDAFIINPTAFANVYGEGNHDEVTTYILDKFRQFSSNKDLIKIIRIRNYLIMTDLDSDDDFIVLRWAHPFMGKAHENFVKRLFEIAPPYNFPYEDSDFDSDSDSDANSDTVSDADYDADSDADS